MATTFFQAHEISITQLAWSPSGRFLASSSLDNTVKIWDAGNDYAFIKEFRGHREAVACIAWSPDERMIASGSADELIKVWAIDAGILLHSLKGHKGFVRSLSWSKDGERLVSCGEDGLVCFWSTAEWPAFVVRQSRQGWTLSVKTSPDGTTLLSGGGDMSVKVWEMNSLISKRSFKGHSKWIDDVEWLPDGDTIISASGDKTIRVWDMRSGKATQILEGHTEKVRSITVSGDGAMLASKSDDGTVKIWDTLGWRQLLTMTELNADPYWPSKISFHPQLPRLASLGNQPGEIRITDIEQEKEPSEKASGEIIKYTAAKIVLVGESGAGKTTLGWHLANSEFKPQESTHGQQFWRLEPLHQINHDGVESEVILWDLAGQHDFRIIHSLFLNDLDLLLLVYDPSEPEPFEGLDFWIELVKVRFEDKVPIILVAAKSDVSPVKMPVADILQFCGEKGINGGFVATSAKNNIGTRELLDMIRAHVNMPDKAITTTTLAFKLIRDFILDLKVRIGNDKSRAIVAQQVMIDQIRNAAGLSFENSARLAQTTLEEFDTAIGHLAKHGHITRFSVALKETYILLLPDLFVNLAADFTIAARSSQDGLGSMDEAMLRDGKYVFNSLAGLHEKDKRILIDAAVGLFIEKDIAIRETLGKRPFLIFPELINKKYLPPVGGLALKEDITFELRGDFQNIFSRIVVRLSYTNVFSRTDQWQDQARFEFGADEVCMIRQDKRHRSIIRLSLSSSANSSNSTRTLFQNLVMYYLEGQNLKVTKLETLSCSNCNFKYDAESTRRLVERKKDAFCPDCGKQIIIAFTEEVATTPTEQEGVIIQDAAKRRLFQNILGDLLREVGHDNKIIPPKCFISYAWGDPVHEAWVKRLVLDLRHAHIDVLYDGDNRPGSYLDNFIEQIDEADCVIVVGTPDYLKKHQSKGTHLLAPIVQAETKLINQIVFKGGDSYQKIYPVLLEGTAQFSFPPLIRTIVGISFTDVTQYFQSLLDLILSIHRTAVEYEVVDALRARVRGI